MATAQALGGLTERSRRLALFVDAFFTKFPTLQHPPFHPKWKEISLTAPLAGWNRLPLAQQWLVKHGLEPIKRERFEAFLQENPAAANVQSEADREALFRQFQGWDAARNARAEMGSQSEKSRDRDHTFQTAIQAVPEHRPHRHAPRARTALDTSSEQGAAIECERIPGATVPTRARENAWWKPFPSSPQGFSTTDHPPSGFLEKQSIPNSGALRP